jgi:hypothetical protein
MDTWICDDLCLSEASFGCPKLRSFETVAMSKKRIEVDIVSDIA